jgi:succinyl-diaminopimelate desuccinylase
MSRPSVDSRDAITFLQALVRLDTVNPPGHESLAADLIQTRLAPLGFEIERLGAEPGRDCLLATLRGTGGGPTLIFNGHTDVQPVGPGWTHDPFGAEIDGDRLYGNGVHDM